MCKLEIFSVLNAVFCVLSRSELINLQFIFTGARETEMSYLLASGDWSRAQNSIWTGTCIVFNPHLHKTH